MKSGRSLLLLLLVALGTLALTLQRGFATEIKLAPGVTLTLQTSRFAAAEHQVRKARGAYIIDGRNAWGVEDAVPETKIDAAWLTLGDQKVPLETSGMYNAWAGKEPAREAFTTIWGAKAHTPDQLTSLVMHCSDGASAYTVQWNVRRGKSWRASIRSAD